MTQIRAIETRYAGCLFRSRLEARWAVFFDTLGIKWEYEPQGYQLPSGPYLPDFWLPDLYVRWVGGPPGVFFEVKAESAPEDKRWRELSEVAGEYVFVGYGLPRPFQHEEWHEGWIEEWGPNSWDRDMTFCRCWSPHSWDRHFHPSTDPSPKTDRVWSLQYGPEGNYHRGPHPEIDHALEAARSARFEHGESGAPRHTSRNDLSWLGADDPLMEYARACREIDEDPVTWEIIKTLETRHMGFMLTRREVREAFTQDGGPAVSNEAIRKALVARRKLAVARARLSRG